MYSFCRTVQEVDEPSLRGIAKVYLLFYSVYISYDVYVVRTTNSKVVGKETKSGGGRPIYLYILRMYIINNYSTVS
jgi:hypothetical protein